MASPVVREPVRAASVAHAALDLLVPGERLQRRHRFAHTHLYSGSRGLIAVTDSSASRSVCAVRVDQHTLDELDDTISLMVGDRTLTAGALTIELRRTWRTRVIALPRPAEETVVALGSALQSTVLGLPRETVVDPTALVGLGSGLTPAGDDVLCGWMAAAHAWAASPVVGVAWQDIAPHLHRTTDLSAQFLRAAHDGHVLAELRALLSALSHGRWESAYRDLIAVGHTSGADLAHGVHLFLSTPHPVPARHHHDEGDLDR